MRKCRIITLFLFGLPTIGLSQSLYLEGQTGIHWNAYDLTVLDNTEVTYQAPPKFHYNLSVAVQISEHLEFIPSFGQSQSPNINFTIDNLDRSYGFRGPSYNEYGLELRYYPVRTKRFSSYIALQFSLNTLRSFNQGFLIRDTVNNYALFIASLPPQTRPFKIQGFQSLSLSIGANWKLNKLISLTLRVSADAVTSRSPIHQVQLSYESPDDGFSGSLLNNAVIPLLSMGIRIDLAQLKTN